MKKYLVLTAVMTLAIIMGIAIGAQAADVPTGDTPALTAPAQPESVPVPVIYDGSAITITSPMETSATAFYFPTDGSYAAGICHTFARVNFTKAPKIVVDLDLTAAQSFGNQEAGSNPMLLGIGAKIGYTVKKPTTTGFSMIPSIGVTFLNDFAQYKTATDIFTNYKI